MTNLSALVETLRKALVKRTPPMQSLPTVHDPMVRSLYVGKNIPSAQYLRYVVEALEHLDRDDPEFADSMRSLEEIGIDYSFTQIAETPDVTPEDIQRVIDYLHRDAEAQFRLKCIDRDQALTRLAACARKRGRSM